MMMATTWLQHCVNIVCTLLAIQPVSVATDVAVYCPFEYFNATCRPSEVLHIVSASYGRMRIGRCVKVNLGYLGCATDVSLVIARRCEAKAQCIVSVADDELRHLKPCPADVTWYLEVSHTCLKVLTRDDVNCREKNDVTMHNDVIQHPGGYISSTSVRLGGGLVMTSSEDGKECTRWLLSVADGQRIRLSLVRLLTVSNTQQQQHWYSDVCVKLGSVLEAGRPVPLTACTTYTSSLDERKQLIVSAGTHSPTLTATDTPPLMTMLYTSTSSNIYVSLAPSIVNDQNSDTVFLLKYDVLSCPLYRNPVKSWVQKIDSNHLTVRCNNSEITWSVTCQDGRWQSSSSNINSCGSAFDNRGRSKVWHEHLVDANSALPMSILIAVAVGVALGIFLGGILLAVVGTRMNSRRQKYRSNDVTSGYATSTLMTSDDDKICHQQQFSSRTIDGSACCYQSEYSIPATSASNDVTCLQQQHEASQSPSTLSYCRSMQCHRGPDTVLRHHVYESPTVLTYSP